MGGDSVDEAESLELRGEPLDKLPHSSREGLRAISAKYLAETIFRIHYLVPHPDQDLTKASAYQGATAGLVGTAELLEAACVLPADVRELRSKWMSIAPFRFLGLISHRIMPIEYSAFGDLMNWGAFAPFLCVLSNESSCKFVDEQLKARADWLHLSTVPGPGRYPIDSNARKRIDAFVTAQLTSFVAPEQQKFVDACHEAMADRPPQTKKISLKSSRHNLTRPNEMALLAFGCAMEEGAISPGTEKRALEWIVKSFDFVQRRRRELIPAGAEGMILNSFLISAPSTYRRFRDRRNLEELTKGFPHRRIAMAAIRSLTFGSTYLVHIDVEGEFPSTLLEHPGFRYVMGMRQAELALYTTLLTRLSAQALVPTLRLSPSIQAISGDLKHLGDCSRSAGPRKQQKRTRLFRRVLAQIGSAVSGPIMERILYFGDEIRGVKFASDLPLEWIPLNGVPIQLLHECSRVPLTPASLAYAVATNVDPVLIPPSALANVLVIRSYEKGDPIEGVLERQLRRELHKGGKVEITLKILDVRSEEELVDAVNSHEGAILILDCHGHFDAKEYVASLVIGGKPIRLWELRKRILHMPPVVLTSSCDTSPVDGAHASAADSLLLLGAKTVIATLLPISAERAAVFVARLLWRISAFVPIALKTQPSLNWREIIAGLIKMTHASEVLVRFLQIGAVAPQNWEECQLAANMDINSRRFDWFQRFCKKVAAESPRSEFRDPRVILEQATILTDALLHVQLGHPELILIWDDKALEKPPVPLLAESSPVAGRS